MSPKSLPVPLQQRRYSVAKIDVSQTYEAGRPKLNGLSDPRLGTMDRAVKCTTDGASQQASLSAVSTQEHEVP